MVRAIIEGRKTQTRRIVKPKDEPKGFWGRREYEGEERMFSRIELAPSDARPWWEVGGINGAEDHNPYGKPGDRIWVKETWKPDPSWGQSSSPTMEIQEGSNILYRSTLPEGHAKQEFGKWRPSIFMRRWMSRITLEVTAVRAERLQNISTEDCREEGCGSAEIPWRADGTTSHPWVDTYKRLWESINGPDSWAANPWVWVVEFRKILP